MTAQDDPYVRVYYRIIDDERFVTVYDDDRALALWLRLLLVSDAMYPAPAPIPHGVHARSLDKLTKAGLVDSVSRGRFRIHGLENERTGRQTRAQEAARARWDKANHAQEPSGRTASAMQTHSNSSAGADVGPLHSAPLRSEPIRSAPVTSIENEDDPRYRANARQMAYLRGDISDAELAEMRAADAVPTPRRSA